MTDNRPKVSTLPSWWRWWGFASLIFALYLMCIVLHWTSAIGRIPVGVSTVAHTLVVCLALGGCVAFVADRLERVRREGFAAGYVAGAHGDDGESGSVIDFPSSRRT